jgi:hypothetical protein
VGVHSINPASAVIARPKVVAIQQIQRLFHPTGLRHFVRNDTQRHFSYNQESADLFVIPEKAGDPAPLSHQVPAAACPRMR